MTPGDFEAVDTARVRLNSTDVFGRSFTDPYSELFSASLKYSAISKLKVYLIEADGTQHGPVTPGRLSAFTKFKFVAVGILHAGIVTITLAKDENPDLQRHFDRLGKTPKLELQNGARMYIFHHAGALGNFSGPIDGIGKVHSVSDTWASKELLLLPPTPGEGHWIRHPSLFVGDLPVDILVAMKGLTSGQSGDKGDPLETRRAS